MTKDAVDPRGSLEKSSDADFLRETIGFALQRLMEAGVGGLAGAAHGGKITMASRSHLLHGMGQDL